MVAWATCIYTFCDRPREPVYPLHGRIRCWEDREHEEGYSVPGSGGRGLSQAAEGRAPPEGLLHISADKGWSRSWPGNSRNLSIQRFTYVFAVVLLYPD